MKETNGRIIRGVGGIYTVGLDGGGTVSCRARGALRSSACDARTAGAYHTGARLERPLTGDRVRVALSDEAELRILGGEGTPDAAQDGSDAVICEILRVNLPEHHIRDQQIEKRQQTSQKYIAQLAFPESTLCKQLFQ